MNVQARHAGRAVAGTRGFTRPSPGLTRAVVLCSIVGLALAGCGGEDAQQTALALQNDIRSQLPDKVRQSSDLRVRVRAVKCTNGSGNAYQCVATISRPDGETLGGTIEDVAIDATCDGEGCVWKSVP